MVVHLFFFISFELVELISFSFTLLQFIFYLLSTIYKTNSKEYRIFVLCFVFILIKICSFEYTLDGKEVQRKHKSMIGNKSMAIKINWIKSHRELVYNWIWCCCFFRLLFRASRSDSGHRKMVNKLWAHSATLNRTKAYKTIATQLLSVNDFVFYMFSWRKGKKNNDIFVQIDFHRVVSIYSHVEWNERCTRARACAMNSVKHK